MRIHTSWLNDESHNKTSLWNFYLQHKCLKVTLRSQIYKTNNPWLNFSKLINPNYSFVMTVKRIHRKKMWLSMHYSGISDKKYLNFIRTSECPKCILNSVQVINKTESSNINRSSANLHACALKQPDIGIFLLTIA